jgi:hypothetical protein
MLLQAHVRNGVIVPDESIQLPEGTLVRIEVVADEPPANPSARRQGGQYAGQIWMAPDFDVPVQI